MKIGGRHNYELNAPTHLRDVYRLITLVLADAELVNHAGKSDDPLNELRERFQEDELVHLMIGTAVVNRSRIDHMIDLRNELGEKAFDPNTYECGLWQPNVTKDEEKTLSFREACNKIIHAMHITAEFDGSISGEFLVMPTTWILRGEFRQKAWQAHLDLIRYARASVMNFSDVG